MKIVLKTAAASLALIAAGPMAQSTAKEVTNGVEDQTVSGAFDNLLQDAKTKMMADPAAALEVVERAEVLVSTLETFPNRNEAFAQVQWLKAEALMRTGASEEAGTVISSALGLAEEFAADTKLYGDVLLAHGRISRRNADVRSAVTSYTQARDVYVELGDGRGEAMSLYSMGTIYRQAENYNKALEYYQRSNDRFAEDQSLSLSTYNAKGLMNQRLGEYDTAREMYQKSLEIAEEMNSPVLKARILTNLAEVEAESGNLDQAEAVGAEALALLAVAGDDHWSRFPKGVLANVAFERDNIGLAVDLIGDAFDGVDIDDTNMSYMDMHFFAHEIYASAGDFESALAHFTSFKRLSDDAKRAASSANVALMGAKFHFVEQQADIERLKSDKMQKDILLMDAQRREEVQMTIMAIGGLLVIFFISAFAVARNHRKKVSKVNETLSFTVEQLHDEIDRRKEIESDLVVARDAAEEANRAKSTFLATMSHELRTPMNGILGFSNVLLSSELDDEQRDHMQIIQSSGQSLLTLINDILDLSQIEAGKFKLRPTVFDFPSTVERAVKLLRAKAQEKDLTLAVHIDPDIPRRVMGDGDRIRQILINLVGNAIKFTENGSVAVMITKGSGEAGVRMSVVDTGIGIPADKVGDLFQRFNQVDGSSSRSYGGTGLGLAISRELIEAMGGQIGVNSTFGEGSEFWADVPLPTVEQGNVVMAENRRWSPEPMSVLVVDEVEVNRDILKSILPGINATPLIAANADEALRILVDRKIAGENTDAIIVSTEMEQTTAVEMRRRILQNELANGARMILSSPKAHDAKKLDRMGYDGVIDQPITEASLFAQLVTATETRVDDEADTPKGRVISLARPKFEGRVLVADDNVANVKLVATLLKSMGVEVDAAGSGKEAVEYASTNAYKMILMDTNMPIMNGHEATRRIRRAGGENEATPIVAFSAGLDTEGNSTDDTDYSFYDGTIAKPVDVNVLASYVRQYVGSSATRKGTDAATAIE